MVSAFIVAFNEADRIGRTLESLRGLSDDIVVVDSGSTDRTREIAAAAGARVVVREWSGYGPQKRFAESLCRHDWVLNLDADEVLGDELRNEIGRLLGRAPRLLADAYRLRIVEMFPHETKAHPLAHEHEYVRLYRKSRGTFSTSRVHDHVELKAGSTLDRLKHPVLHYSMRGTTEQIAKFNGYSSELAEDRWLSGRKLSASRVFLDLPLGFVKAYVGRMYLARGVPGFVASVNYAVFRYLRSAKYYEISRAARVRDERNASTDRFHFPPRRHRGAAVSAGTGQAGEHRTGTARADEPAESG